MRTILVDDIPISMKGFEQECRDNPDVDIVGMFTSSADALAFSKENEVDFALLDIDMPVMNGLELAKALKEINPLMIIMFVTAHATYAVDAMRLKADYIIFKPFDHDDVEDAINRAKLLRERQKPRVQVHTFGSFAVSVDGKPMHFSNRKSKELFAFCVVNNGKPVSNNEVIMTLWEDYDGLASECHSYRSAITRLKKDLCKYDIENIFYHEGTVSQIRRNMIDCDYFHFMDGSKKYALDFDGKFLIDYSWSEEYIYHLLDLKKEFLYNSQ